MKQAGAGPPGTALQQWARQAWGVGMGQRRVLGGHGAALRHQGGGRGTGA